MFTIDDPARMSKIAASFGTTPEAIYALNKELTHTDSTNGAKYFVAGTKIKIPTEVPAENKYLQARGSQQYEKARGNQLWGDITNSVNQETASRSESLIRLKQSNNFSNFRDFAINLFKEEGVEKPNRYLVDARVLELKDMNPDLVDGNLSGQTIRFKYNAKKEAQVHTQWLQYERAQYEKRLQQENAIAEPIAKQIFNTIDDYSFAIQQGGGYKVVQGITANNVISVLEKYKKLNNGSSLLNHINNEGDTTIGDTNNKSAMYYIANALAERCKNAGIEPANIKQSLESMHSYINDLDITKLDNLVDKLCSQCRLLESRSSEEINSSAQRGVSTNIATMAGLDIHSSNASSTLDNFNKYDETMCGRLWEGLKYVFSLGTAHNLDENVKADIAKFDGYIKDLQNAYKTGGEKGFNAKFQEIFDTKFDSNIARAYAVKLENFQNASAIKNITDYVDNFRGAWNINELGYNNLVNCCKGVLAKLDPSNKQLDQTVEEIIMNKLGNAYSNATPEQKRKALASALRDVLNDLNSKYQNYSGGKSIEELGHDLTQHSGDLFKNKHDMFDRVNNYIVAQKEGDAYVSTGLKIGAMAAFGLMGGGFALSFTGTFASNLGIDVLNSNDLSKEDLWEYTKSAAIDGLLSGAGTIVRDGLKAGKFMIGNKAIDIRKYVDITKGNASYLKTQGVLVTADSTVSTVGQTIKGGTNLENIGITLLWSTIAHVRSAKIVGKTNFSDSTKSNVERCFRRTGKGGGKEQRVANKNFSSNVADATGIKPEEIKSQVQLYIAGINNLGNLNAVKRFVMNIPEDQGQNELLTMINSRQQELLANRSSISVDNISMPPELRSNAISALNQQAEHLLPDQLNNIMDYIDLITDPKELNKTIILLQRHDINLNEESELRYVLDDKYAELQMKPPYETTPGSVLYATINQSGENSSPAQSTLSANQDLTTELTPVATPTIDKFNTTSNNITQLDPASFYKIQNEVEQFLQNCSSQGEVDQLIQKLDFIGNENQKQQLLRIISSHATLA